MEQVLFEPHDKQEEFINAVFSNQYKYLMFGGGAGGGKTFVSLAILILLCKIYPNSKYFVIRESLPSLKRTTIPSFLKLCPQSFIQTYNQTDQVVTFRNGSQLHFLPENYHQDKHLTRFDGIECNGFLIEEGQEINKKTFEKCKLRAGRHIIDGMAIQPKPIILVTCNPSQGWIKDVFHEPAMNGELPEDYYYLRSTMHDNPSLTDEYKSNMKNLDEVTYNIFVKGNWNILDVDRPFAYAFDRTKHTQKGLKVDKSMHIILSFDFNVDPITCIAGQSYEGKIRILKEFRLRNSNIYELCEEINTTFPKNTYFLVTGDASGSSRSAMVRGSMNYYKAIQKELMVTRNQFKVPSVNPSLKNSRVLVNSMLERHEDLLIDEGCRFLIEDLQYCETTETGDIDKTKDKHRSHLLDCFRYYLWTFHNNFLKIMN